MKNINRIKFVNVLKLKNLNENIKFLNSFTHYALMFWPSLCLSTNLCFYFYVFRFLINDLLFYLWRLGTVFWLEGKKSEPPGEQGFTHRIARSQQSTSPGFRSPDQPEEAERVYSFSEKDNAIWFCLGIRYRLGVVIFHSSFVLFRPSQFSENLIIPGFLSLEDQSTGLWDGEGDRILWRAGSHPYGIRSRD